MRPDKPACDGALLWESAGGLGKVGLAILYRRKLGLQTVFVALNLGSKLEFIEVESFTGTILLSTHCDRANEKCQGRIDLRPDEGLVILSKLRC